MFNSSLTPNRLGERNLHGTPLEFPKDRWVNKKHASKNIEKLYAKLILTMKPDYYTDSCGNYYFDGYIDFKAFDGKKKKI